MKKETEDKLSCFGNSVDEMELRKIKENLDNEKSLNLLSSIFKAIGDPTRLRIIYTLSKSSLCVCDIASILDMSQSAISHQLKILRDLNLVRYKREGKMVVYSLDDDHVFEIIEQGLVHTRHLSNDY